MASSSKCFFLVFLCLFALLSSEYAQGRDNRQSRQGPCNLYPDCNKHCIELLSYYKSGKCVQVGPTIPNLICTCFLYKLRR
ncbi:unnamed protein product [Cochlearia groenlandica]